VSKYRPIQVKNQRKSGVPQADSVATIFNKGLALHQQGQLAQARALYEQVLAMQPKHFDALHLFGVIAIQCQEPALAVAIIEQAININPKDAVAYANLGTAFLELKLHEDAIRSYDLALSIKPDYAEAQYNRSLSLLELKRYELAIESCNNAIAIRPDYAEAHYNRGLALLELKRYEDAIKSCDSAIAIKPDYPEAHSNRGIALQRLNRLEEAVSSFEKAIAIRSNYAEAHTNLGSALQKLNRIEESLASYDRAIAIRPDHADTYFNKALILLLDGQFETGWKLNEFRWKTTSKKLEFRAFNQPLWLGSQSLAGKTILLHAEQGLGDTIQFCPYTKSVKALGASVLLEVPKPLMGLLKQLEGVDILIESGSTLPAFDYHCPLMSLPLAFKTNLENIPNPEAYLTNSADQREVWSQRLGTKVKPRVGIVWSGNPSHNNDRNRSLSLERLTQQLPTVFEYVSLQKDIADSDREMLEVRKIKFFGENLHDFSDTAALCDLMDIVISVDTSVAHLAGALGKATWVLLPYAPDWRWMLDRDSSPWYASVKLYRQSHDMNWGPVLNLIACDLMNQQEIFATNVA
jgi:tetratricopeptide (TPR) repeat protein